MDKTNKSAPDLKIKPISKFKIINAIQNIPPGLANSSSLVSTEGHVPCVYKPWDNKQLLESGDQAAGNITNEASPMAGNGAILPNNNNCNCKRLVQAEQAKVASICKLNTKSLVIRRPSVARVEPAWKSPQTMKLIRGATELPKHLPCSTDDWPELSELSFDSNNPFGMMELSLYSEILAPSMNEADQSFDCLSQLESPIQTQAHPPSTSSSSLYNSKAAPPTIGRRLIFKPNYNGLPKPASEGTREVREELDLFPNPPLSIRCEALEKIVQML